jgi:hypothetical protein
LIFLRPKQGCQEFPGTPHRCTADIREQGRSFSRFSFTARPFNSTSGVPSQYSFNVSTGSPFPFRLWRVCIYILHKICKLKQVNSNHLVYR